MASTPKKLTDQQRLFVDYYTLSFEATRAAKKAGYSEKTANQIGWQLLQLPSVREAIDEILERNAKRNDELRYRVIRELTRIGFANIKDYGTFDHTGFRIHGSDDMDDDLAAVIQEFHVTETDTSRSVKFKLASKEKALEMLGRHLGMFTDRVEVEGLQPFVIHKQDGTEVILGAKPKKDAG